MKHINVVNVANVHKPYFLWKSVNRECLKMLLPSLTVCKQKMIQNSKIPRKTKKRMAFCHPLLLFQSTKNQMGTTIRVKKEAVLFLFQIFLKKMKFTFFCECYRNTHSPSTEIRSRFSRGIFEQRKEQPLKSGCSFCRVKITQIKCF